MRNFVITKSNTNLENDSLKRYLREVSSIPQFILDEEIICASKASLGDKVAFDELITRNLRFVVSVAKSYVTPSIHLIDLINEGNIGLIKAAEKFDPSNGFKFISYAVWWIQKGILDYLVKYGRTIRFPANQINGLSKLDKKISNLEQIHERNIYISDILETVEKSDLNDYELLTVLTTYSMDSLDREIGGEDGNTSVLGDFIFDEDSYGNTDKLTKLSDSKLEVEKILNLLKPRDRQMIIMLFGLDGNEPKTLKEVGDHFGFSGELIRQIRQKSLLMLKDKLSKQMSFY